MTRILLLASLAALEACADSSDGGDTGVVGDSGGEDLGDPGISNYVPPSYPPVDPLTVVFLGDSITAGVGAGDGRSYSELLEENDDATYPDYAEIDLQSQFPTATTFVNVAQGGAQTNDLPDQIAAIESQLSFPVAGPVMIGLTIGGNDLVNVIFNPSTRQQTVDAINANIGSFISWTEDASKFPDGAYVYLANVYDPSDGVGEAEECFFGFDTSEAVIALQDANAANRVMAEQRGFAMVDMHGHFLGHGLNYDMTDNAEYDAADPTLWFESDCIHPNERGHHELRRVFFGAMAGEPVPVEGP